MRGWTTMKVQALRAASIVCFVAAVVLVPAYLGRATVPSPGYSPVPPERLVIRMAPDGKVLPPEKGLYVGVFEPPSPFGMSRLNAYEKNYRKRAAIVMWYQSWADPSFNMFRTKEINALLKRGTIPMISWEPWEPGGYPHYLKNPAKQPRYSLRRIIAGYHDAYIRSWARGAKAVDGPIMLRPMHEMNGYWYPWSGLVNGNSPAEYRAAWRHIHDIFIEEGATNVTWVWSINRNSTPDTYANRFAAYYPGSDYVDWTSISGFNWGRTAKSPRGHSFAALYTKPLAYLRTLKKPIIISEIACNSSVVGKPAWIRDAYTQVLVNHHEVKGIVYFDHREVEARSTQNWQLSSSAASEDAYRSVISSRMFVGGSRTSLIGTSSGTP